MKALAIIAFVVASTNSLGLASNVENIKSLIDRSVIAEKELEIFKETVRSDGIWSSIVQEELMKYIESEMAKKVSQMENLVREIEEDTRQVTEVKNKLNNLPLPNCNIVPESGWYPIRIGYGHSLTYCELAGDGDPWIVFQKREPGYPDADFQRGWNDFKHGFRLGESQFWWGLEKVHTMTNSTGAPLIEMRMDMEDFHGSTGYVIHQKFAIGSERDLYRIYFDMPLYRAPVRDFALTCEHWTYGLRYNYGMPFSTMERDHDLETNWGVKSCAERLGPWWHRRCTMVNFNGFTRQRGIEKASKIFFYCFNKHNPLKRVSMKFRPM